MNRVRGLARITRMIERPANRGPYIEHVIDEGHLPDEPCDICAALSGDSRANGEPGPGLNQAWAEAEAATDRGMLSVERLATGSWGAQGWSVYPTRRVREVGPTPVAALRALASRLRALREAQNG